MVLVNILHMSYGDGESSECSFCIICLDCCIFLFIFIFFLQEGVVRKALPVLKNSIKGIGSQDVVFGQCFKIADIGCSSSKNTILVASNIIDIVCEA